MSHSVGPLQLVLRRLCGPCPETMSTLSWPFLLGWEKKFAPEAAFELAEHATDDALTPAEVNVLRLIAAGNSNKQIAAQLSITDETVKGRVKSIL